MKDKEMELLKRRNHSAQDVLVAREVLSHYESELERYESELERATRNLEEFREAKPPLQWAAVNGQVFPMGINKAVEYHQDPTCGCGNEIAEEIANYHAYTYDGVDTFICHSCSAYQMLELGDYRE